MIPLSLDNSMFAASALFAVGLWFIIHRAARLLNIPSQKKWMISFGTLIGTALWYCAILFPGKSGFFDETPLWIIPNIGFAFIIIYYLVKKLYELPILQTIFDVMPPQWVMYVQVFRVMGIGFLNFYFLGLIPGIFAIPTAIGDVFVGLAGPIVGYLYARKIFYAKQIAITWNWIGIGDLALALTLGISTYPRPFQIISTQISNEPIALFPLVMVPLFAVPLSIFLHFSSLRVLHKK